MVKDRDPDDWMSRDFFGGGTVCRTAGYEG